MKLYFFFTYNTSLEDWKMNGSLDREINYYHKLEQKGFKVNFITYGEKNDYEIANKYKIKVIPIFANIKKTKNKYVNFIKSFFFLYYLKNYPLDNSVFKTNQMKGSWLAILAAKIYKKKIFLRSGYEYYRFCKLSKAGFFKIYLSYIYSFIAYRFANKISITSDYEKKFICKNFKLKYNSISVLPNFIDTSEFKKFICKKVYDVIFVGRLEDQKNLPLLINAIKNNNLKFLLIGTGKLKLQIIELCNKSGISIKHFDKISNKSLPKYYNSSKIFITTTLYEGNPKSILEAMSCEMPVISVNFHGHESILENNVDSIVTNYSEIDIEMRLKKILKDQTLLEKIGRNARQKIIKNNDINKIVNEEFNILINEIS